MISVSYIIPVFNGEKYLTACAESVLPQLQPRDEAIFVDDGSADGSIQLLEKLAQAHSGLVRVIRQKNLGAAAARNAGLRQAGGTYIAFLDCDDCLEDHAVSCLREKAGTSGNPDLLLFDATVIRELEDGEGPESLLQENLYRSRRPIAGILPGKEMFLRLNEDGSYRQPPTMCWIRRGFLTDNGISFPEGICYEDALFMAEAFLKADTSILIVQPLYRRRVRPGSVMTERRTYYHARSAWLCQLGLRRLAWGQDRDTVLWLDRQADQMERQALEIYGNLSEEEVREGENRYPDGLLLKNGAGERSVRTAAPVRRGAERKAPKEELRDAEARKTREEEICREEFQPENPLVSAILPVYNGEKTLPATLRDLKNQTLRNFEMIFVDDGSEDGTSSFLEAAAKDDPRIRLIRQENRFAGAARNAGMDQAHGKYLIFLDGDDRFDRRLLARAAAEAIHTEAQAVVFDADCWDESTGSILDAPFLSPCGGLPEGVFPAAAAKKGLFMSLNPWNKLYRRDYIRELGIRFQEQFSCNDLFFTMTALACAERITAMPETLVHYRITSGGQNISARKDRSPLDVFNAFSAVRQELEKRGLFETFRIPFAAKAIESMLRSMDTFRSPDSVRTLYERLREGGWDVLAADAPAAEDMTMPGGAEILNRCRRMQEMPFDDYVLERLRAPASGGSGGGSREIQELRNSYAYRIGCRITWLPHQIKQSVLRFRRKKGS